ncbi:unnamed protein product [Moneuplotes crassus]|uniref:Uncharacterized protein n=1 Tax=Euplotes crassus TaxID=5936 RepID=A0AAD1UE20_EUPCR|nr:unnamed protein product [Moneuplotes crassus]
MGSKPSGSKFCKRFDTDVSLRPCSPTILLTNEEVLKQFREKGHDCLKGETLTDENFYFLQMLKAFNPKDQEESSMKEYICKFKDEFYLNYSSLFIILVSTVINKCLGCYYNVLPNDPATLNIIKSFIELLENNYVDQQGNKLFPDQYYLNKRSQDDDVFTFLIKSKNCKIILEIIKKHPEKMIKLCNSECKWSLLHIFAMKGIKFDEDEQMCVKWLIFNTDDPKPNWMNKNFLETAITQGTTNFSFFCLCYKKKAMLPLLVYIMKKTSIRDNLLPIVLKSYANLDEKALDITLLKDIMKPNFYSMIEENKSFFHKYSI